jgi:hypothetical protein
VTRIRTLQFDNRIIDSSSGRLYIRNPKDKTQVQKVLLMCKFTFAEKYEKVYSLLYFRSHMMLIIEFPDEKSNEAYLANFEKQMEYYQKKKVDLKQTQISDELTVNKQLKFLVDYNEKYKFDFLFSELLNSHHGLEVEDKLIFFFKERPNPDKVGKSVLNADNNPEEVLEEGQEAHPEDPDAQSELKSEALSEAEGEGEGEGEEGEEDLEEGKSLDSIRCLCCGLSIM